MKRLLLPLFLVLTLWLATSPARAQVRIPTVGDTTNVNKEDTVKYGPETTFFYTQSSLQFNRAEQQSLDTTLTDAYNFHPVEAAGNNLQYLGTLGMATRPLFPESPDVTGVRLGLNAFDAYVTDPREMRYYNTKSPYILMHPTFGGNGRNAVHVIFTQNVRPNLNVGVSFKTINVETQVGRTSSQDRVVESSQINFFADYHSKNKKYDFLFNFTRFGHNVEEYGGINAELVEVGNNPYRNFFRYQNATVWLDEFRAKEIRFNYHFYHQYKISDLLQVYHDFDRRHQDNYFFNHLETGQLEVDNGDYFRRILLDTARTLDATRYELWDNEIGIKGQLSRLFYSLHYRIRQPFIDYNRSNVTSLPTYGQVQTGDRRRTELYAGFDLRLDLGERTFLSGGADYLSAESYRLEAEFNNPILKGKFVRTRTLPTFIETQFTGNHIFWNNDFDPVGMDQLTGSAEYQFSNFYLRPYITATNINRPIYYRRDTTSVPTESPQLVSRQAFPEQSGGGLRMLSPGVQVDVDFLRRMHWQNWVTYTNRSGPAADRMPTPDWLIRSRLYYENSFQNGNITLQVGIDAQYTSGWLAYDYDVSTQQFFLQSDGIPDNGPVGELQSPFPERDDIFVIDAFFVMKVRTARIYIKVPYVNQDLQEDGYFASPFYSGQQRALADVGIRWMFFD